MPPPKRKVIIAVFVAYNAAKTLQAFYEKFPRHLVDEVILVDDASQDGTYRLARQLGITAYQNPINLGYGGNLKRALELALDAGGDILIDIHPDGEYDASAIGPALEQIESGARFVLGRRFNNVLEMLQHGMYPWKVVPLIFIDLLPRLILERRFRDFHQGFRVYTREMLEQISWRENANNYLFSFQIICQAYFKKIPIAQVPVTVLYQGEKKGASLKHSVIYTLGTVHTLILYLLVRIGVWSRIFQEPSD